MAPDISPVSTVPQATASPHRGPLVVAVAGFGLFLSVFLLWMAYSYVSVTFYRDDNVVEFAPLMVEGAKQVLAGKLPLHTRNLGGGGGIPILSSSYPGILNPFTLLPAMLLSNNPEWMINSIASLHLALFALGGFFLACSMGAPLWACLVSGLSLGFSGCFAIFASNWISVFLPFAFSPWLLTGIAQLYETSNRRKLIGSEVLMALSVFCLFYSGSPHAACYGGIVAIVFLISLILESSLNMKRFFLRLIPQVLWFLVAIVPLLWMFRSFLNCHPLDQSNLAARFADLSVPLQANLGLLIPTISSSWRIPWSKHILIFSSLIVSCGIVPAWIIFISSLRDTYLLRNRTVCILFAGIVLMIILIAPNSFGLTRVFAITPILKLMFYPFRGIPALHILVVILFAYLTSIVPRNWNLNKQVAIVTICLIGSMAAFEIEVSHLTPSRGQIVLSWYAINTSFPDRSEWGADTIAKLRDSGYVINLGQDLSHSSNNAPQTKPRLFLYGNLGLEYRIRTVHHYLTSMPALGYRELGMEPVGVIRDLKAVRELLERGLQSPPAAGADISWENGIAPRDLNELGAKTYVGAAIIETAWEEAMQYFLKSPQWMKIDTNPWATVFVRNGEATKEETAGF